MACFAEDSSQGRDTTVFYQRKVQRHGEAMSRVMTRGVATKQATALGRAGLNCEVEESAFCRVVSSYLPIR